MSGQAGVRDRSDALRRVRRGTRRPLRPLRRAYRHLTRSQARVAWALTAASIVVYGLYPESWPATDPVRQFFLVVASVAAGAAFLPELSSSLWHIRADEVRSLIPDDKVTSLEQALIRAQVDEPEWADRVHRAALLPLLAAGERPHLVVADLSYTTQVHPASEVQLGGTTLTLHRVETALRARRVLPPGGPRAVYWVAVARDRAALGTEFHEPTCLFREVVELDPELTDEQWRELVLRLCSARIVLDGAAVEASTTPPDGHEVPGGDRLVRWYFTSSDLARLASEATRSSITISLDYAVSATCNRFHVALSAFYVMGSAHVAFRLYDQGDDYELFHDVFLARGLDDPVDTTYVAKSALCKEVTVVTSDDSLLWPGSGVSISWRRRDALDGGQPPGPAPGRAGTVD